MHRVFQLLYGVRYVAIWPNLNLIHLRRRYISNAFGTSVSGKPPNPPHPPTHVGRYSPLDVFSLAFEILRLILLSASFVRDLRWPNLHTCIRQFNIYFNYVTLDGGVGTGPGGDFLETISRYRVCGNN